jgi:hypothetical protein
MDIGRRIFKPGYQLEMAQASRQAPVGTAPCRSCTATDWWASSMRGAPEGRPLRAGATHQDIPAGKTTSAAVREAIRDLARWLELDVNCRR